MQAGNNTRVIHHGDSFAGDTGTVMPPIFSTSTFAHGNAGGFDYTRSGNPNFRILDGVLAAVEGCAHATVFASGVSAITAVGIVLLIGLLCAPVLIHVERSTSLKSLMLKSAGTGLLLCGGGMMLAVLWDLPPGPLIGVLCMALLILRRP